MNTPAHLASKRLILLIAEVRGFVDRLEEVETVDRRGLWNGTEVNPAAGGAKFELERLLEAAEKWTMDLPKDISRWEKLLKQRNRAHLKKASCKYY